MRLRIGTLVAVVGVLAACVGAVLLGTRLGSPTASPPDGTVLLPAGVPHQSRHLGRGAQTEGEVLTDSPVVFRPDGLIVHLGGDRRSAAYRDPVLDRIVGSVGFAGEIGEIAGSPDGRRLYASDVGGVLRVVDLDTRDSDASILLGGRPQAVAVAPDGSRVYVGDSVNGTISQIDPSTAQVLNFWHLDRPVSDLAVGADGRRLVVLDRAAGRVDVLDTGPGATVATARAPSGPFYATADHTAVAAGSTSAFVAGGDGVTVLDLATGTASHAPWTAGPVTALALSPDGSRLYLLVQDDRGDGTTRLHILVVDPGRNRVIGRTDPSVDASGGAAALTVSPDGHRLVLTGGEQTSQLFELR